MNLGDCKFEEDNLILQLKNMPKPPISKELAKEIGFDSKKYESLINNLLLQISEVRKERLKENYIFEEKLKSMKVIYGNDSHNNNINTNKNKKMNSNRPKSNYKSIKSSGYGIQQKKIKIFSSRQRKIAKNLPNNKIITKEAIKNIPINKKNKILINHKNRILKNKSKEKEKIHKLNNNSNIGNNSNNKLMYCNNLINEIKKIQNENKKIEQKYQTKEKKEKNENKINDKKEEKDKILILKNNLELIKKNEELISKNIINELFYELIQDLKHIEEQNELKKNKITQIKEIKPVYNNQINYKSDKLVTCPDIKIIESCKKSKNEFMEYMKMKGSFYVENIFDIYDKFVEENYNKIVEQGLNYCIKQMDDFIEKICNK